MRGVLLLAVGNPFYGIWAQQLAQSIKYHNPGVKIQLITDAKVKAAIERPKFFDTIEIIKDEHYLLSRGDGLRRQKRISPPLAKVNLDKYLRFEETIYLDVDAIAIKDIEPLFDICKGKYYATQVVGQTGYIKGVYPEMLWAKIDHIFEKYELPKDAILPAINSSFVYLKKGDELTRLYKAIRAAFAKGEMSDLNLTWGATKDLPDELYTNIALAKCETDAKIDIEPMCFSRHRVGDVKEVAKKHYLIGYYGDAKFTHKDLQGAYDVLMSKYSKGQHFSKFHELIGRKFYKNEYKWR